MYESVTFEILIKRMLERIPLGMDKSEGSIIYDALAPCAVELQLMYIELDVILNETFADTSSREYLIRRAAERGVTPFFATNAILKGVFNIEIEIGTKFTCYGLNYVAIEKICDFEYKVQCETLGSDGNRNFGKLIPFSHIDGLTIAELVEVLIPAEDDEETESLRARYFDSFKIKAYGGNVADYLEKTNSIAGVGATKVTPIWNGGGTVKLTILDSEFNRASDILIETVQTEIDPTGDAMGVGVAPIGHIVTVDTVSDILINIAANIIFDEGFNFSDLENTITLTIDGYLLEIRKEWSSVDFSTIRIAQIESRLMSINGVLDISKTTINGNNENLILDKYEAPIMGVISNN